MYVLLAFMLIAASNLYSQNLPEWFIPLRDSVYEQNLETGQIVPLYRSTKDKAGLSLTGANLYVMLSRCEYMMGRAYQYEGKKDEAARHYDEGMSWAQKALDAGESAEAWQMLAENISQSCAVRSTAYAMANGLKVERYSKNALSINRRNAAAQYMIAARWVFAPAPFNNLKKGIEMMEAIITGGDMEKDDRFNVYSAIGYAYSQRKQYPQGRSWLLKSLEVFPSNKYVQELLKKC
jgi:tetratricopeptide (TPR) repeat protein